MKTSSGYIPVSTPEMTAYDLVRYRKGAVSINHIATVITELAEKLDAKRLLAIAIKGEELPVVQRLGYLLEKAGHEKLTEPLFTFVHRHKPKMVPLEPASGEQISERDRRWSVLVNATIEVEA